MEPTNLIIGLAIVLNISISIFIAKRKDLEPSQIKIQILLVWLIPFVAAIGLWLLNKSHDKIEKRKETFGATPIDAGSEHSGGEDAGD